MSVDDQDWIDVSQERMIVCGLVESKENKGES